MNPEYLGLTASTIILLAGCMQDEKKLRIIDTIGSVLMTIYGFAINSLSVVVLNTGLTAAHIYRLHKIHIKEGSQNAKRGQSEQQSEP